MGLQAKERQGMVDWVEGEELDTVLCNLTPAGLRNSVGDAKVIAKKE